MVYGVDERIRRAEEIYARRQSLRERTKRATVNVSEPKNFKLFKKLALQIIICVLIYYSFYLVSTTNYTFSKDALNKIKDLVSHDFDFAGVYNSILESVNNFLYSDNEEKGEGEKTEDNVEGSQEITQDNSSSQVAANNGENSDNEEGAISEENVNQSEVKHTEESETDRIKNKYAFVLPASRENFF